MRLISSFILCIYYITCDGDNTTLAPAAVSVLLSFAERGVNDHVVIVLAIDDVSSAGDKRQVGEAVERTGTKDLCTHRWVGSLLDGVGLNLVNLEANVNVCINGVDDDLVTRMEFLEVSEDLRPSKRIVDMPGKRGRAWLARDAAAAIPECRMPDRIANRTFWRIHLFSHGESDSKHRGIDLE